MSLIEIIARLEAATEGSRELDAQISSARGIQCFVEFTDTELVHYILDRAVAQGKRELPRYTTSLDAALTLVPEGYDLGALTRHEGKWLAATYSPKNPYLGWASRGQHDNRVLALCIAALKARSAS